MRRTRTSIVASANIVLLLMLPASAFAGDQPELEFDGRDWELGHQAGNSLIQVKEYVLVGETVHNWSELVTWQYFGCWQGRESTVEIMRQLLHRSMIRGLTVEWEVLSKGFDSVLYTWEIASDGEACGYFELTRIVKAHDGLHFLRYATKNRETFLENLGAWIQSFQDIEISE